MKKVKNLINVINLISEELTKEELNECVINLNCLRLGRMTKEERAEEDAIKFLDQFTSDWADLAGDLTALDIVITMRDKNIMPNDISLWEPFENYNPSRLVRDYFIY